jgi:hypothetical protein
VVALLAVALIGSIGIIVPVAVYLAGGAKAGKVLGGWKVWLAAHNAAIMAVLLLVLGVNLVGQGIAAA